MAASTYRLMERIINNAIKDGELDERRDEIMEKLDTFYAVGRLTKTEYEGLVALMGGTDNE